jgi:hypothetical protein
MWMTPKLSGRINADERIGEVSDGVLLMARSGDCIRITFSIGAADGKVSCFSGYGALEEFILLELDDGTSNGCCDL